MQWGALHPWHIKYLFADLLLFTSAEGDEATSSSFATAKVPIEDSNASLEALIEI